MPVTKPTLPVPETSALDAAGWPICIHCLHRLRGQFGGYGWNARGHFCSKDCAASWAEKEVIGDDAT